MDFGRVVFFLRFCSFLSLLGGKENFFRMVDIVVLEIRGYWKGKSMGF